MLDGKTKIFGCRVTNKEADHLEGAADGQKKKPARWLRDLATVAPKTCKGCGFVRTLVPGVQDAGCPNCAMQDTEAGHPKPRLVVTSVITCPDCGHSRDKWDEKVGPGPDPGCPCKKRLAKKWSAEWADMETMEPGEAMARFTELRAGRKLPKGFGGWSKSERIAWLDREMPL